MIAAEVQVTETTVEKITASKNWERLLIVFSAISTICIFGVVIYFSRYGFDFTDESFYVIWFSDPTAYHIHIPVSLFGFIYHPLYILLNADIATIRIANVLITSAIAWILSFFLLKNFWGSKQSNFAFLLIISAAISTPALLSFGSWLLTPSYNTLAFQSLVLTIVGLLLLNESNASKHTLGWLLVGAGGWLAFMAKPTTAAALALIIPLCWLGSGHKRWRPMVLAATFASLLLLLSALLIDGSIGGFVARLTSSIDMLRLLGSGQEFSKIFRVDFFTLNSRELALIAVISSFTFFATLFFMRQSGFLYIAAVLGCLSIAGIALVLILSGRFSLTLQRTILFVIPITLVAIFAVHFKRRYLEHLSRQHMALALLLLLTPHIYAFGTNGNYWFQGSEAAFFWILAAVVLLSPIAKISQSIMTLIPVALVSQFLVVFMINYGINNPYRQPHSLRENTAPLNLRDQGNLVLSTGFHEYLTNALRVAREAGFRQGMAAIDLTGQSPGIFYALGAHGLGQPWMVGAYPGSDKLAVASLNQVDCNDIASAWLLEEPGGPRSLTVAAILRHIGAKRDTDYEVVGSFKTAAYAGGYVEPRTQNFLKPTRPADVAASACLNARKHSAIAEGN